MFYWYFGGMRQRIRSRLDGYSRRKPRWVCSQCLRVYKTKTFCCDDKAAQYCASTAEARRYVDLLRLEDAGEISDLRAQVSMPIVIEGRRITTYRADFVYTDGRTGEQVIEDVKPSGTRWSDEVYRLKRALIEALYDVEIHEVRGGRRTR